MLPGATMFFNIDCIDGAKKYLADSSIDLIITDPPYGIKGDTLHKHYNRNEANVLGGYIDVPESKYKEFSEQWIKEAERVLRPGGSIYIVSGYSNLRHILNALEQTSLEEINHIIWKYNFGVYTKNKYISSHYHILYYCKPGKKPTFNTYSRFSDSEKSESNGSMNYQDREDVWIINREYKPGQIKNKNELPSQLLIKMIQYSSNPGDTVCDFFLGSFSTAKIAIGLSRKAVGFEKSVTAFDHQIKEVQKIKPGSLLSQLRVPPKNVLHKQGEPISDKERSEIKAMFTALQKKGLTKKESLAAITKKTGRGYWSLLKIIDQKKI